MVFISLKLDAAGATGFENLRGSRGDDIIRGDASANILIGGGGIDTIYGGDGHDVIYAHNWSGRREPNSHEANKYKTAVITVKGKAFLVKIFIPFEKSF